MSYSRTYARRSRPPCPDGRIARANKFDGACHYCGQNVPAGTGQLFGNAGRYECAHLAMHWAGSPVSGQYVAGCPGEADKMNDGAPWSATATPVTVATEPAEPSRSRSYGSKYAYTSTGARVTMSSRRCEDAPCCGCCD